MSGESIWCKFLLLALFSSFVFANPISKLNEGTDDVYVTTVDETEEEGSKGGESEHTATSVVKEETTESSMQEDDLNSNSSLALNANTTELSSFENTTLDENETATEISLIEAEKYPEEVKLSNQTTFQPTILEESSKNSGVNLTETFFENVNESDSPIDIEEEVLTREDDEETKTPEIIKDASTDTLDVQPHIKFPDHFEEERIKGDTQVYENDISLDNDDLELVTEISKQDTTPPSVETTVLSLKVNYPEEEKLVTALRPKEKSQLSLLLKERLDQIQRKNFVPESPDIETSEAPKSIDSNNQPEEQTEVTPALDETLQGTVEPEAPNGEESQRDTETTTHVNFENAFRYDGSDVISPTTIEVPAKSDVETTTENISEKEEEEAGIDITTVDTNYVALIGQSDEREQTPESSLDEKGETAESLKDNSEPEIINKIYRSEIEELKNKLITRVRLEGSSSNIGENIQQTKAESTTEVYESTTLLNLNEQYESVETTVSPDSISGRNSTIDASESQTELIESPTEERHKNKGSDYWLEMMGNRGNKIRNRTWSNDDKAFEDTETSSKREESVTYAPTKFEDATKVYIISDENETSHAGEFDLIVTTDISETREETKIPDLPSTEPPRRENGSDTEHKDIFTEEPITIEPITEETVIQENEIKTATPPEVEFNADDKHEITTQVTITTVTDLEKNEEERTATLPSYQVKEKTTPSKEGLESSLKEKDLEETHVENETKTESPISKSTEAEGEQESEHEETQRDTNTTESGSHYVEASSSTNQEKKKNKPEEENEASAVGATSEIHTKPQRIEQRLSHLAEKFGKLELRPVFRRRAKHGPKRKLVDRYRFRKQLF